jgi:hypothetical protein
MSPRPAPRLSPARLAAAGLAFAAVAACDGTTRLPSAPDAPAPALAKTAPTAAVVEFTGCVESIGVTLAPTAAVRPLVPAAFVLAGDGQPVTPFVVRTARCAISVDGARAKVGEIVQIGAIIVPPDGTGDVNSALLWYYTADAKLAHALSRLGVDAQHAPTIEYEVAVGAPGSERAFRVEVRPPGSPTLTLTGTVVESTAPAGSFVANWWAVGPAGVVKMSTTVPSIATGGASLTLTTPPADALGAVLGGGTAGFPLVQQFNTFAAAHMVVTVAP